MLDKNICDVYSVLYIFWLQTCSQYGQALNPGWVCAHN